MRILLLLATLSTLSFAQIREGEVVDAITGAPIAGVYISSSSGVAVSDASGHFQLNGPAGVAVRAGYLRGYPILDGNSGTFRVELMPQAAISGMVEDEGGFPVKGARGFACRYEFVNGRRVLQYTASFETNEFGEYRVHGLFAGRYHILVYSNAGTGPGRGYAEQYYPGTLEPHDENLAEVAAGQEKTGVNIRLTRPEGVNVSGSITIPEGTPSPRVISLRYSHDRSSLAAVAWRPSGEFLFRHVPPGSYILRATFESRFRPRAGDLVAEQRIEVGTSAVNGIVLTPKRLESVDVAGKATYQGARRPRRIGITLEGPLAITAVAKEGDDGSFVFRGLVPGHYRIRTPLAYAKYAGRDVLQAGFDIEPGSSGALEIGVIMNAPRVRGTLLDAQGRPMAGATVLFQPSGKGNPVAVTTSPKGTLSAAFSAPGEYRVYAVADAALSNAFEDPAYLKEHANDMPAVVVADGVNPPLKLTFPAR